MLIFWIKKKNSHLDLNATSLVSLHSAEINILPGWNININGADRCRFEYKSSQKASTMTRLGLGEKQF